MTKEKYSVPHELEVHTELTPQHHELLRLLKQGGISTVTGEHLQRTAMTAHTFFYELRFAQLEDVRRKLIKTKKIPPNSLYLPKDSLSFLAVTDTGLLTFASQELPREYVNILASYLTRNVHVPVGYDACAQCIREVIAYHESAQAAHIQRKRYAGKAAELAARGFDAGWKKNIETVRSGGFQFSRTQFEEYRGLFFDCLGVFADKTIDQAMLALTPETPFGLYEKQGGMSGPSPLSKTVEYTPVTAGPEWKHPRDLDGLFVSLSHYFQRTLEKAVAEYTLQLESTTDTTVASIYEGYESLVALGRNGDHLADFGGGMRPQLYYLLRGGFNTCIDSFMQFSRDCFAEIYERAADAEEQTAGSFLPTVHTELLSSWHILMAESALHIMDFGYLTECLMPFFGPPRSGFYQVDANNDYYLDPQLLRTANGYRFREDQRRYFPFRTLPKQGCPARQRVSGEKSGIERMIEWMAYVTTYTVFAEIRSKAQQNFKYRRVLVSRSLKNKITRL